MSKDINLLFLHSLSDGGPCLIVQGHCLAVLIGIFSLVQGHYLAVLIDIFSFGSGPLSGSADWHAANDEGGALQQIPKGVQHQEETEGVANECVCGVHRDDQARFLSTGLECHQDACEQVCFIRLLGL